MVSIRKFQRLPRPPINKPPTRAAHHDGISSDNKGIVHPEIHVLDQKNPSETVATPHGTVASSALVSIPTTSTSMILEQDEELDIEQLELQRAATDTRHGVDTRTREWVDICRGINIPIDLRARDGADIRSASGDVEAESSISEFPAQLNRSWSEDEEDVELGDWKVSKIVSRCLVVEREMSFEERMKYIFGSSIVSSSRFSGKGKGQSRRTLRSPRQFIASAGGSKF